MRILASLGRDNLRIDATDIEENSQFANTIATGTYASELLKGSPHQDLLAKYSHPAAAPAMWSSTARFAIASSIDGTISCPYGPSATIMTWSYARTSSCT